MDLYPTKAGFQSFSGCAIKNNCSKITLVLTSLSPSYFPHPLLLSSLSSPAGEEGGEDMMPGQIPDPSLTAGTLPSLGPLAGIPATTLTDQLKLADFCNLGAMLSPVHFLGRLGKRTLEIKEEVRTGETGREGLKAGGQIEVQVEAKDRVLLGGFVMKSGCWDLNGIPFFVFSSVPLYVGK